MLKVTKLFAGTERELIITETDRKITVKNKWEIEREKVRWEQISYLINVFILCSCSFTLGVLVTILYN